MKRREFLKTAAAATAAYGMWPEMGYGFKGPQGWDADSCVQIMNLGGQQPQEAIELYRAIHAVLEKAPDATFRAVAEDEKVQALCKEQGLTHIGGPMLGCLTDTGASVWVRTVAPAKVEVKVQIDGKEKTFGPVKSTFESDLSAVVVVTGLEPGAVTPYKVFVDAKQISVSGRAEIRTPSSDKAEQTRIAVGTCPHRWGLANVKQSNMILKRRPHAMLLSGDIAVQDKKNNFAMHRADYSLRDFHPAWRNLVSATPVYASWDDHDYYANDAWGIPRNGTDEVRRSIREVYQYSWNNPYYGLGDEGGGIFQHTRIGPCDIIMTDNRYFREREGKHCFLGKEQMAWLKKTLKACKGPFIIMSSSTMWSDYVSNGKDSWGRYDREGREEIFALIEKEKIGGVLLTSGDRHGARGFRIPRPSGFEFYEFEPASLGGRTGPAATSEKWTTQLYGISGKYAFGEFTFDVSKDDPTVTYRLIQDSGEVLYELELKRSQLTPGN